MRRKRMSKRRVKARMWLYGRLTALDSLNYDIPIPAGWRHHPYLDIWVGMSGRYWRWCDGCYYY